MISLKVAGLDQVRRRLEKIKADLSKRRTANARAIALVDRWVQENFKGEGEKVGGWAPLKESTIKGRKRNKTGLVKILQSNGDLRRRWDHIIDDDNAILRSGVDYGQYPDKGTSKMVQRRILPTKEEAWKLVKVVYEDLIRKALH